MPKVPKMNKPMPKRPASTTIICWKPGATDAQKAEDMKQLEAYMVFRKARAEKKKPSSLPHPLKCSKCDYIATSVKDSHDHWSLEH